VSDRIEVQTIEMGGFRAALVGYVDNYGWDNGLAYLRMVGTHNAVRAIWAGLVGDNKRQRKAKTNWEVKIGSSHVQVGAVKYHTVSAVLPSGQLDLVMLHPFCTVANASSTVVFIADAEAEGPPPGWFERLNAACKLPLLPGWAELLWERGQNTVSTVVPRQIRDHFDRTKDEWVMKTELREEHRLLIRKLDSKGNVQGYHVDVSEDAEPFWLAVIKGILGEK
jgi:hypothetical protein